LVATGIWNVAAEQDKITGKLPDDADGQARRGTGAGVTAFLHARSRSTAGLAVFGAVTLAFALAALFLGILVQAEPK
jgi:hypothetical protein